MSKKRRSTRSATLRPSRNAPCPCGSGRAYKNCCAGKEKAGAETRTGTRRSHAGLVFVLLCVLVGGVVVFGMWRPWTDRSVAGGGPEEWEYDEGRDQYWHPGHQHWHDGRPPADVGTAPSDAPPEPWEYDPVRNRHWDPEHGHWHDGRPPNQANP